MPALSYPRQEHSSLCSAEGAQPERIQEKRPGKSKTQFCSVPPPPRFCGSEEDISFPGASFRQEEVVPGSVCSFLLLSLLACYLDIVKGEAACCYSCCLALALSLTPEPLFSMLVAL